MNQNPVLALCIALVLAVACSSTAVAQSASPNLGSPLLAEPPSSGELSNALSIQRTIASKAREAKAVRRHLEEIDAMRAATAKELTKLNLIEDEIGVSFDSFPEIVKNLQAKRIELIIDLAGIEAKREAITRAEAAEPYSSAIVAPLKKVIALQQTRIAAIKRGNASSAEVRAAEASLLASEVQLARLKSENSGSKLLQDALLDTSLALAEAKARLAKTESLLDKILPARTQLESSKQLKERALSYFQDATELTKQLRATNLAIDRLSAELKQAKDEK